MSGSSGQSVSIDLPNEILIEIFLACVDDEAVDCTLDSIKSAPWVLASVCRLWRNICLATPALWSRLSIALERQDVSPRQLTRALALSSPEHLDMSLSLRDERSSSFPLFEIIIPHLDRCRSLALTMNDAFLTELADCHCDFQHLEELRLTVLPRDDDDPLPPRPFDISRSAPLLSRFTASFRCEYGSVDTYVSIDWSKLTHLTLDSISLDRVHFILQNTAALQAFRLIYTSSASNSFSPKGPVIRLNHLTTLTFECFGLGRPRMLCWASEYPFHWTARLLDRLALPSLSTLLSNFTGEYYTYISLIHRSQCSITHLRAALTPCSSEQMLELLGALPTLRVLEVFMDNLPSILRSMESFLSTPILSPFIPVPSLQHLKFLTQNNDGIPDNLKDMLEHFIRSRTEDLLSRIPGDRHDLVKFQLLESVSLYLPLSPMAPSFKSQVFWHLTGQPGDMKEDPTCHERAIWRTSLYSLVDIQSIDFDGVMSSSSSVFMLSHRCLG